MLLLVTDVDMSSNRSSVWSGFTLARLYTHSFLIYCTFWQSCRRPAPMYKEFTPQLTTICFGNIKTTMCNAASSCNATPPQSHLMKSDWLPNRMQSSPRQCGAGWRWRGRLVCGKKWKGQMLCYFHSQAHSWKLTMCVASQTSQSLQPNNRRASKTKTKTQYASLQHHNFLFPGYFSKALSSKPPHPPPSSPCAFGPI